MEQIRSKLITPEEFDGRLISEPGFADQIGGFATYSLEHLLRAINQKRFAVPTYPTGDGDQVIRCFLNESVLLGLDGSKSEFAEIETSMPARLLKLVRGLKGSYQEQVRRKFREEPLINWVQDNRHYGSYWAFTSAVEEMRGREVLRQGFDLGADESLQVAISEVSDIYQTATGTDLRRLVDLKIRDLTNESARIQLQGWLKENFGKARDRHRLFEEIYLNQGVQLVYGDPKNLLDFIKSDEYLLVDDIGVEIYRPIPGDLVKWVIPLGPREQQRLL